VLAEGVAQTGLGLADYLARAEAVILPSRLSATAPPVQVNGKPLRVGVDLGTAYLVMVVLDEDGLPLAGEWQYAEVVRDGLVVDFIAAVDRLLEMKTRLQRRIGRELTHAASAYPPGVPRAEVRATANVIESSGLECTGLIAEPSAANNVLRLADGAVVDVGGGTTGVAVLQDGKVVYTADEATGGRHFSLVIAGSLNMSFEEAEQLKLQTGEQSRLYPLVRPVMEKIATITARHIHGWQVPEIALVGGSSAFRGMAEVVAEVTGIPARVPPNPLFVTPLGIALHDPAQ
jgi:ethanolamine utilization protein EutJ